MVVLTTVLGMISPLVLCPGILRLLHVEIRKRRFSDTSCVVSSPRLIIPTIRPDPGAEKPKPLNSPVLGSSTPPPATPEWPRAQLPRARCSSLRDVPGQVVNLVVG